MLDSVRRIRRNWMGIVDCFPRGRVVGDIASRPGSALRYLGDLVNERRVGFTGLVLLRVLRNDTPCPRFAFATPFKPSSRILGGAQIRFRQISQPFTKSCCSLSRRTLSGKRPCFSGYRRRAINLACLAVSRLPRERCIVALSMMFSSLVRTTR